MDMAMPFFVQTAITHDMPRLVGASGGQVTFTVVTVLAIGLGLIALAIYMSHQFRWAHSWLGEHLIAAFQVIGVLVALFSITAVPFIMSSKSNASPEERIARSIENNYEIRVGSPQFYSSTNTWSFVGLTDSEEYDCTLYVLVDDEYTVTCEDSAGNDVRLSD